LVGLGVFELVVCERRSMNAWISRFLSYLTKFLEVGVLLLAVSVLAEIIFGPNVPFFGSQVTENLITILNSLGEQGIAALIIVFAVIFTYRKFLK
jgi:hypothetical protein